MYITDNPQDIVDRVEGFSVYDLHMLHMAMESNNVEAIDPSVVDAALILIVKRGHKNAVKCTQTQTLNLNTTKKVTNMSTPIKKVTYVYGCDLSVMNEEQIMSLIRDAQGEIKTLNSLGVESTNLANKVAKHEEAIALCVEALDRSE